MNVKPEWIKIAYKKLKSSIYFDKTQLPLRNQIVEFENSCKNLENTLESLWKSFSDKNKWRRLECSILKSISYRAYPKSFSNDEPNIITNAVPEKHKIEKLQHFIDMDVRGHILSVLWVMMIGWHLDKEIYEHSYGNRLRKVLINEDTDEPTYSPHLFKPYFEQYEGWRDTALIDAQKSLNKNQDVVIISLDFTSYFYSVDMNQAAFDLVLDEIPEEEVDDDELYKRINNFVFKVIKKFSRKFGEQYEGRNFFPIGFLPSNILAN